jgi:hypothetical protein
MEEEAAPQFSHPYFRGEKMNLKGKSVLSGGSFTTPVMVTSKALLKLMTLFSADSFPKYFLAIDSVITTVFSPASAFSFPSSHSYRKSLKYPESVKVTLGSL